MAPSASTRRHGAADDPADLGHLGPRRPGNHPDLRPGRHGGRGDGDDRQPIGLTDTAAAGPGGANGAIRFDDVSFHYGRKGGIIEDLSLDIEPGERIGLVGRSGAGKSTLVNLLLRFYDLETGRITIDGQDVAEATQASIRQHISVVTQGHLAAGHRSIHDNIAYGRRLGLPRRGDGGGAAAGACGSSSSSSSATGTAAPGFDAHVGERGGETLRRPAPAHRDRPRAILKNAPILILDEATSALDSEVEQAIQASLEGPDAGPHGDRDRPPAPRRSRRMDRLVILDKGRIVEQGTHARVAGALGGHYARSVGAGSPAGFWRRRDEAAERPCESPAEKESLFLL
ncbi:MAG: ATP-binding cassette domain-containing protein [Rhizobium sp.]|nr:ATP-binding cassette domain-containing protein [Rhizobium sp.]